MEKFLYVYNVDKRTISFNKSSIPSNEKDNYNILKNEKPNYYFHGTPGSNIESILKQGINNVIIYCKIDHEHVYHYLPSKK
tara:strand:+ start:243 stop:485 length:243 start_codon:yes stop_codon:yes gene_type:complete